MHQRRQIIDALKEQKDAMVAALWANPNWDDTKEAKGNRKNAIEGINEDFADAVEAIEAAFTTRVVPDEEKLSTDNPFFAAAERGLEKVDARVKQMLGDRPPHLKDAESEEVDYMKEIDQG